MRKLGRILLRILAALVLLAAVCALTGILVFRSGWFAEQVHRRAVMEIEKATGGRVEIGNFSYDWKRLEVTVGPVVLHGKESASEPPFVRVASVTAGLRIISMMERKVDLASLKIEHPRVRIVFYPDGTDNIPEPEVHRPETTWAQDLVHLAVGRYEVMDGLFEDDDRQIPLDFRGEDLRVRMTYEKLANRYRGELESNRLRVVTNVAGPIEVSASAAFTLSGSTIDVSRLRVATKDTRADLTGSLTNLRWPRGTFNVKLSTTAREAVKLLALPIEPVGTAIFDGKLNVAFEKPFGFSMAGRVTARGLGYRQERIKIENADVRGDVRVGLQELTLENATANAFGATINGKASLLHWRDVHAEGNLQNLDMREAAHIVTDRPIPWNGKLAGGFSLDAEIGKQAAKFQGNIGIYPAVEGAPIEGHLDVVYDQAAGTVQLGNSYLKTASTRVDFQGTLGQTLDVRGQTTNLDEVHTVISMELPDAPKELPLKLRNGQAAIVGVVKGPLDNPHFNGQGSITNGIITIENAGHAFDSFTATIDADSNNVRFTAFNLVRGATTIDGQAGISARNGSFEDGLIDAKFNVHNAQLAELLKEVGSKVDATGTGSASVHLFGSVKKPVAEVTTQMERLAALDEQIDRMTAKIHYADDTITVSGGDAVVGPGRIHFDASLDKADAVAFTVDAENVPGSRVKALGKLPMRPDAILSANLKGTGRVVKGEFALTSVSGDASARSITLNGDGVGDISLTVQTRGADLSVHATAVVRGTKLEADGAWKLEGDEPGAVTIQVPRVDLATAHRVYMIGGTDEQKNEVLPFEGFIEGHAKVAISLQKPQDFRAEVTLDQLQINARKSQALKLGVQPQDVVLKNSKPVMATITAKEVRIQSAQFAARDTSLEATGGIPFDTRSPADLAVRGSVNLAILQLYNADLLARGNATVQATVRGSLRDPQMNGRMELKKASLYLADLPNGIDNAEGSITFDRNRATIEKLTAETGGGKILFSGFVELRDVLTYRLQADVQQVRVRYPEDVSTTSNARLALNGTSDASTLSGSITLVRAAFNPHSDLGGLMALASKPVPAPATPNEYLSGMQFDVRIESGPNFEFQTTLTRDVEAEVDLRLRGTPIRPVLLGSISVNEGEIQVFGNRYTVDRGDIRFLNPVKIEPTFDMDLETKARGIIVNISFSGTMQKLNVNYSSDPPLQPREIIALLAVGRNPANLSSTSPAELEANSTTGLQAGGGLLGDAISAQLSSSIQRFFGASRVKIDPTVTGVDNLPQARLTLEQQVSKEITLTYITNLNRTQEQVVQVEYDFGAHWSAIAVRQDNGLFGIDFQYRKRFK
ncbi:MAG TPA: translocation/assembly module TamB domain-containing protein [Bryobacteraceae bacterium]|jgi:translocation and assembly module TamB|nr:translocation/assembly module TamB domain-containing protein [Bryobacteraceae bacterium]